METHKVPTRNKLIKLIKRVPKKETHEFLKRDAALDLKYSLASPRIELPYEFYEFVSNATRERKIVLDNKNMYKKGLGQTHKTHKLICEYLSMSPGPYGSPGESGGTTSRAIHHPPRRRTALPVTSLERFGTFRQEGA